MDLCSTQAAISAVSVVLSLLLLAGLNLEGRAGAWMVLAWLLWTAARTAFYLVGPVYLGGVSNGVPRLQGEHGIFFFFVMPFTLGGERK